MFREIPRGSSMGFVSESQIRTRLAGGGRRIRTTGPSRVEYLCFDWFCRLEGWKKPVEKSPPLRGGPAVRIRLPPALSPLRTSFSGGKRGRVRRDDKGR